MANRELLYKPLMYTTAQGSFKESPAFVQMSSKCSYVVLLIVWVILGVGYIQTTKLTERIDANRLTSD